MSGSRIKGLSHLVLRSGIRVSRMKSSSRIDQRSQIFTLRRAPYWLNDTKVKQLIEKYMACVRLASGTLPGEFDGSIIK